MLNYSQLEDNRLLALSSGGDREAEEQLVIRYMRLVRMCSRPLFLVGGTPEDLIQEGMLGLLSAIRRYDPDLNASFKTYAELCIRNRLFSAVKSATSKKHEPINDGQSLEEILSDESKLPLLAYTEFFRRTPEEQVLARENKDELQKYFRKNLSPMESKVLDLYLQGLSYEEIAEQSGKSVKSVDNAIQRIRRKLAQNLNSGVISYG